MWATDNLIILSDLHLGPADVGWAYSGSAEVAAFIDWVVAEVPGPCHVVLAGDIFDFLLRAEATAPAAGLMPDSATALVAPLLDSHSSLGLALQRLARAPRHNLIFLSGNHDPELVLPAVRRQVEAWIGQPSEQPPLRWVVHGEGALFEVGGARVLVEHGDLFDEWNRVDHDGLRLSLARYQRGLPIDKNYRAPLGSSLFQKFVLPLGASHPWISALKPEREAAFPLVHALLPAHRQPGYRKALIDALPDLARSFVAKMIGKRRPPELRRGRLEPSDKRQLLKDWLAEEERAATRGAAEEHKTGALIKRLRKVAAEDTYFELEVEDEYAREIEWLLASGADAMVCGHSHAAKAYPLGKGLYLNSGTWQRLLALPQSSVSDSDWEGFLAELESGRAPQSWRRTFVRVSRCETGDQAEASLLQWTVSGVETLRSFSFDRSARGWEAIA